MCGTTLAITVSEDSKPISGDSLAEYEKNGYEREWQMRHNALCVCLSVNILSCKWQCLARPHSKRAKRMGRRLRDWIAITGKLAISHEWLAQSIYTNGVIRPSLVHRLNTVATKTCWKFAAEFQLWRNRLTKQVRCCCYSKRRQQVRSPETRMGRNVKSD